MSDKFISEIILGADLLDDCGGFDADAMRKALDACKETAAARYIDIDESDRFDDEELHAFAAAIEYFGEVPEAITAIQRGEYRHCPDVQTYEDLGWEILREETNLDHLPQLVLDYMDFESLGRDVSRDGERGKFTKFGYFTPQRW
ncbi:MAG: antirestriction protein ArdA [Selenomonadaceae bacterium]|nr:antirestriction protein ArdA [Selenomonadaceae bacterium]